MARRLITILVAALVGGFVLVGAGCGGSSSSSSTTETTATTTAPTTETTETTATTEATTTTEETTTTSTNVASAADCQELANIGQKFSSAFTGNATDLEKTKQVLNDLAANAPADIKDDFQTLADAWSKIASALKGVDLSSGQTPDAQTLAKLQALSTQIDTTKLTQASQNIATWVQQNCTG